MYQKSRKFGIPNRLYLKLLLTMRLTIVIIIACLMQVSASSLAQKVTLTKSNASLRSVFKELNQQTGYNFFYADNLLENSIPVTINVKDAELPAVLKQIFAAQNLDFTIRNQTVVIKAGVKANVDVISGFVGDAKEHKPIPGVTVSIKGTKSAVQTDKSGKFSISIPQGATSLEFRFIGYKTVDVPISSNSNYTIYMQEDQLTLNETVITGMVDRKVSTYTGAAKTITGAELKAVSPVNVFAGIAALDPSFRIIPNNKIGGNINALPEITMRGQTSYPTLGSELVGNPNTPLFILDGFQVSLQAIVDLDMNQIASVTLLKDASATAMYGSRGGNGVMVVTTILPPRGKVEVSITNNLTLSSPDLSVYHMLNSEEKLDFERRVGFLNSYRGQAINAERYKAMLSGVNTDWKSIPVQTGINNRTNLSLRGGDQSLTFNLTFSGNLLQGVMKEQDRKNYSGSFTLSYKTNNLTFQNNTIATQVISNDSPYGEFSQYLALNPYWKPYDENGNINQYLENINLGFGVAGSVVLNPLMDIKYNTINNRNKNFNLRNNTTIRYDYSKSLWFTGALGITKVNGTIDNFYSALDSRFDGIADLSARGSYSKDNSDAFTMDGTGAVNYNKNFGKHGVTVYAGFRLASTSLNSYNVSTQGFPFDRLDNILFAAQYLNSRPTGTESTINNLSYTGSANYSYDNRYFTDFTYTRDGSSAYGENNKFGNFWSAGLGWNINNEQFLKDSRTVNLLRIRGSYGSTGTSVQNPYAAQFRYNLGTSTGYFGEVGAIPGALGNPNLSWQQVLKSNIGIASAFLDNRLTFNAEFYNEVTQNALTTVSLASSTGFPSYTENLGKIQNRGLQLDLGYTILSDPRKGLKWNVSVNAATNKSVLKEVSDKLKAFNAALNANNPDQTAENAQFIEGQSTTAIYAVRSLGIDPVTGQEVYLKADGTPTFVWDVNDKTYVGDTRPRWTGAINSNFLYAGFALNFSFNYNYGADLYNSTLLNRVEAVDARNNVDRRAYDLGWTGPGSLSPYRRITTSPTPTKLTSRFVQRDNNIQLSSINLSYQFKTAFVKKLGLQNLSVSATTNNLATFSSIEIERGTDNPFAREYTFGLSARF
ncbi:SusC/RagA family TonB-linked outer membrane protein [Pedobacter sp. D749]|uniref:SusC/RagA family TonB-linked outer membrane protein n=1 Tax=Pedobacter sp. D749 TaxID=2856523 RepID=UPI001C57A6BF|nr:SusC/RagA family TonB-linked outer membrane protein [Pedobacter sp. D749]QXU39906.1 SusC/RagA family TonB-linked outer membrane protein [Pedobacter sp. D749]